ncbi:MAG TPA: hypothetical protein VFQ96_01250 [Microbacteriaceae bacterium]|nr:hypothetical protein [Microbacteriaceae bacterium]
MPTLSSDTPDGAKKNGGTATEPGPEPDGDDAASVSHVLSGHAGSRARDLQNGFTIEAPSRLGGARAAGGVTLQRSALSRTSIRLLFLIPGAIALLSGLDAALLLLGVWSPVMTERLPVVHGPLLVFGFVGTVITLERAVAVRRWWGFGSPSFYGLGGILLLTPLPIQVGQVLFGLGGVVLLFIYLAIWRRQKMLSSAIQSLGAFLAVASALLWIGGYDADALVPGMAGFMVLTIAGERVELARLVTLSKTTERTAFGVCAGQAVGVLMAMLWPAVGYPIFGLSLIAVVAWLAVFDAAPRLAKLPGLPRYIALCLLAGYGWLIVAGLIWTVAGPVTNGPWYDGAVHSVFLGFTIAMIMAHAPVILPAVLRRPLPYYPIFALPVILLNASLVLRILIGDLYSIPLMVQIGGIVNVIALLLFVIFSVISVVRGKQPARVPALPRTGVWAARSVAPSPAAVAPAPEEAS